MTQEKNQEALENLSETTFSLVDSKRRIKWALFSTGVLGGVLGAIFINTILYWKPNSGRFWQESIFNKAPLADSSSNDWLANRIGSVDREEILHDRAQALASAHVSDKELEDKLSSFLTLYDGVLEGLMAEKKVLLLERDAFATHRVPDFTEEVKRRLQQTESQRAESQQTKDQP